MRFSLRLFISTSPFRIMGKQGPLANECVKTLMLQLSVAFPDVVQACIPCCSSLNTRCVKD